MTPAGTSNELDVQNEWEENITHTHIRKVLLVGDRRGVFKRFQERKRKEKLLYFLSITHNTTGSARTFLVHLILRIHIYNSSISTVCRKYFE